MLLFLSGVDASGVTIEASQINPQRVRDQHYKSNRPDNTRRQPTKRNVREKLQIPSRRGRNGLRVSQVDDVERSAGPKPTT